MTEDDKFLARWSRRKREAAVQSTPATRDDAAPASDETPGTPSPPHPRVAQPDAATEPAFDPKSLPPIESIVSDSDIRAFLQPGVPADLTRAALRRAWSADPAIRNFIGLAENSWDFTAPDAMPGFGPLDPAEIPQLLAKVFGADAGAAIKSDHAPDDRATPAQAATDSPSKTTSLESEPLPPHDEAAPAESAQDKNANLSRSNSNDIAVRDNPSGTSEQPTRPRRGHGGALPG